MEPGNIVVLNGTSSSGKSTTARAFQQLMDVPYVHTGIDHFLPRVPQQCFTIGDSRDNPPPVDYFLLLYTGSAPRRVAQSEGGETVFGLGQFAGMRIGPAGLALLAAMYRGIAALAVSGVSVIVDDVIHDERVLRAAVGAFGDLPVLFVGLRLPLEVARQRERDRGDRGPGGAAAFYDRVHAHGVYDLELDTSRMSPEQCAARIRDALASDGVGDAFRRLHAAFTVQPP